MAKKGKRGKGRPTKFTAKNRALIIKALKGGAMWEEACAAAGCGLTTVQNWRVKGEEEDAGKDYVDFWVESTKAYTEGTARLLKVIESGANGELEAIETIRTKIRRRPTKKDIEDGLEEDEDGMVLVEVVEAQKRKKIPASSDAKWLATRRNPELYGDQQKHKHEGQLDVVRTVIHNVGGAPPISFENAVDPDDPLPTEED